MEKVIDLRPALLELQKKYPHNDLFESVLLYWAHATILTPKMVNIWSEVSPLFEEWEGLTEEDIRVGHEFLDEFIND